VKKTLQNTDLDTLPMLKRIIGNYLKQYIRPLSIALLYMVLASLMTLAFAKLTEPVFDHVLVGKRSDLLFPVALAVLFCFVIRGGATYMHKLIMGKVGQSIVADIQNDLFRSFIDLDLKFFHENPSGTLVSRVISDVNVMRLAISDVLAGIGVNLLTLIFLVGLMFYQDWHLALISCIAFPLAAVFTSRVGKRMRKVSVTIQGEMANLTDTLTQIFQGIRQVKSYGAEDYERNRSYKAIIRVRDLAINGTYFIWWQTGIGRQPDSWRVNFIYDCFWSGLSANQEACTS
jgi:subfamily B ATP-binding cassette protein MsbA